MESNEVFTLCGEVLIILGVILWYIYTGIKEKKALKKIERTDNDQTEKPVGSQTIPFSQIRTYSFPRDIFDRYKFETYTIRKSLLEAFQMYLTLSPDIITTVTKIQKSLTTVHVELLQDDIDEDMIDLKLGKVLTAVNQLEAVSNALLTEIEKVTAGSGDDVSLTPIDGELVKAYVQIVNTIESMGTEYSNLNLELYALLRRNYKEKIPTLNEISEKLIYILFMEVVYCGNQLDKYITGYGREVEG